MIGLLGGAFDPPHIGHVALADAAEQELDLEQVVVVVVADPGHKDVHAPAETRLELARLAFPGREVMLDHHARTADMLRDGPWDDPVFLIGADAFVDFPAWKEPAEVLRRARLGVATRPGYPRERLDETLAALGAPGRVVFFDLEPHALASHELRADIARPGMPPAVRRIIEQHGLYGSPGYPEGT